MQRFVCGKCSSIMQIDLECKKITCPNCNKIEKLKKFEIEDYLEDLKRETIDTIIMMDYKDAKNFLKMIS